MYVHMPGWGKNQGVKYKECTWGGGCGKMSFVWPEVCWTPAMEFGHTMLSVLVALKGSTSSLLFIYLFVSLRG